MTTQESLQNATHSRERQLSRNSVIGIGFVALAVAGTFLGAREYIAHNMHPAQDFGKNEFGLNGQTQSDAFHQQLEQGTVHIPSLSDGGSHDN